MMLAAFPIYDSWHDRWRAEVLDQVPGQTARWRPLRFNDATGLQFAAFFEDLKEAQAHCEELNSLASLEIEREEDPNRRLSLRLRADKGLQAKRRLAQEEQLMLVEAGRRQASVTFDPSALELGATAEKFRPLIEEQLRQFPYVKLLIVREVRRPLLFYRSSDGRWSGPRYPNKLGVASGRRARIADGFGLSGLAHWGKTKAAIRKILLPRANELLQRAGVKRMLADALREGKKVLVWGNYVFWYEPHNNVGWLVKDRSSQADGTDGEAIWYEGTICSRNHGRIVVLPYIKEDGSHVTGHTKNAPHDGPAMPRHPDDIVEIPFEELDGDLMIGLLGELPYE